VVCLKNELIYKEALQTELYKVIHSEARIQNITRADAALHAQERNANAVATSKFPQGSWGFLLQKYTSLLKSTTTPPAEHAAANERIAATCIEQSILSELRNQHSECSISGV
jgi:hypothetical protein